MNAKKKRQLTVRLGLSEVPEIGPWLWALQDARRRTLEDLEGLAPGVIGWTPSANDSSIASILYHIAYIEADWLYLEVLEKPIPEEVESHFGQGLRHEDGRLVQTREQTKAEHFERLEKIRALLLNVFQEMDLLDFRRPRSLPDYDVTPEWVLHHLLQHEAEHRSQMGAIRAQAEMR